MHNARSACPTTSVHAETAPHTLRSRSERETRWSVQPGKCCVSAPCPSLAVSVHPHHGAINGWWAGLWLKSAVSRWSLDWPSHRRKCLQFDAMLIDPHQRSRRPSSQFCAHALLSKGTGDPPNGQGWARLSQLSRGRPRRAGRSAMDRLPGCPRRSNRRSASGGGSGCPGSPDRPHGRAVPVFHLIQIQMERVQAARVCRGQAKVCHGR